jgi:hypothetical protein
MGFAEADETGAFGVARDGALEADGAKRIVGAFGGADDSEVSSKIEPEPGTL